MAVIENWLPPSRENWEFVMFVFKFFPLFAAFQLVPFVNDNFYNMGKTSTHSKFKMPMLPGRIAWITMELPGVTTLLYCMSTLPAQGITSLPLENKVLGGMFAIHYIYRAILGPLLAPSMSPISIFVWLSAFSFQIANGLSIGGWLGGYGPVTRQDWLTEKNLNYKSGARFEFGLMLWALGLAANIFHDDELREIRRSAMRKQKKEEKDGNRKKAEPVYMIPQNGLFRWILFPHYLCEWIEWTGFWIMAGPRCVPARTFLINEIATMLPRAVQGKQWYEKKFGREKIAGRKAIIPGLL